MKKINNKKFFKGKKIVLIISTSTLLILSGCGDTYNNYYYPETHTKEETVSKTEESTFVLETPEVAPSSTEIETEGTIETEETNENEDNMTNEEKVFKYFNEKKEDLKEYLKSDDVEKIKEKGKELFITFVDFIFYDGEIKGIKYDDLSEAAKKQLFEDFCAIDSIISDYVPNYKENISSKYNAVKDFVSPYYYSIISKIKDAIGSDNLEKINDLKDDAASKASDMIEDGKQKLKEKYEEWRNK